MNILTFDLEDWFHILDHEAVASPSSWNEMESRVERNTDRILELLDEKNLTATWFCLGWIAKKYPALVKKIAANHELANHSMDHQLLFRQNRDLAKKDILATTALLENLSGKKVNAYRAPGFSFTSKTNWLVDILAEAGLCYDSSVFPARRNHGGYEQFPYSKPCRISSAGIEIREFPMSSMKVLGKKIIFSGGGYFRLFPYSIVSGWMKKSDYVMTYFHPRDFDAGQPVLKSLSFKRKLMSYTGLKNSFSRLKMLLNDFTFISLNEAGKSTDWNKTPLINLNSIG